MQLLFQLIFLKNVFGNEPTTPPIILPIPSASTPEPTLLSSISISDTSPIAFKHPTFSIVVTKYAGKMLLILLNRMLLRIQVF